MLGFKRKMRDIRTMNELFPAADREAAADGRSLATAADLVLAAVGLAEGSGVRVLAACDVDLAALRSALRAVHDNAIGLPGGDGLDDRLPPPAPPRGVQRSAPDAQRLFRAVVDRVRTSRSELYGAWFLLEAAGAEEGVLARALAHLGVERHDLDGAARAELERLGVRV